MQPMPSRPVAPARPAVSVSEPPLPPAVAAAVWRGDQLGRAPAAARSSGFAALDAQLPGGGWPCQGLTELLCPPPGMLVWRLLAPLLRAPASPVPAASAAPVLLVGPPHRPHPPGLRADGIDERALVWLQAQSPAERLWTTEQLLKARTPGVLIVWLPQARAEQLRRLQVLAGTGQGPVFVCRPQAAAREASAAPLRLCLRGGESWWSLRVDVLKRPGPPLMRTLSLPSVPAGLAAVLPPRLLRADAAASPAPAHEEDHVLVRPVAA